MNPLLPIGTRVNHFDGGPHTHGPGTIVEYNCVLDNAYVKENLPEAAELAAKVGMLSGLVETFYSSDRCPYIVQWDNGYKDVYEPQSLTVIPHGSRYVVRYDTISANGKVNSTYMLFTRDTVSYCAAKHEGTPYYLEEAQFTARYWADAKRYLDDVQIRLELW